VKWTRGKNGAFCRVWCDRWRLLVVATTRLKRCSLVELATVLFLSLARQKWPVFCYTDSGAPAYKAEPTIDEVSGELPLSSHTINITVP